MEESSGNKRKIEVCHSPALFEAYYDNSDCTVVVIDIFRATSAMVTAFANGVNSIIPVETLDEARDYQSKGFLAAAERKGEQVEGFELGNSPFHYQNERVKGKDVVLTTTNGTKAIKIAERANHLIIGSFLNITAVVKQIEKLDKDLILLCAGWRDRYNLEDTLFAGAVVSAIEKNLRFGELSDSAISSREMYENAEGDLYKYLENSSHRRRLSRLNLEEDIIFCLQHDIYDNVPYLEDGRLIVEPIGIAAE